MYRIVAPYFILFIMMLTLFSCQQTGTNTESDINQIYQEKHRPQFHFSPEANWMNDPNGMVYLDGEYHLFYQYYPDSTVWGPMHWGHAVSKDLNHWEHLPIAIYPDSLGWIFSGSAVYDKDNTSGLGENGKGPLVAIFTHHNPIIEATGADDFQYQSIAYSNDKGRTWTMYNDNPVVDNPGIRDFRDPKVIWHEPTKKWIMTVTALDHVKFYASSDLKEWEWKSDFGKKLGSHDGVWECPDLFPLITNSGKEYWVLLQNMNPGNPNGGSGLQYFIGQFDGNTFVIDPKFETLLKSIPAHIPDGVVFENFENGYGQWNAVGDAFGDTSSKGALASQQEVRGYEGDFLVNSFNRGDNATGELSSPEFIINSSFINFKIGGGNHRGRTLIALEVDGKRVREAEGKNNEKLEWRGWNVASFKGKKAQIRIIDNHKGSWGHINIDQIVFANELAHEEISGSVWLDAGRDNYAGVTWDNTQNINKERKFMGWMSNWAYAQVVPTEKWRSAMTLPWNLSIKEINDIPRLIGNPILVEELKRKKTTIKEGITRLPANGLVNLQLESLSASDSVSISFSNEFEETVLITYDPTTSSIILDRSKSGDGSFSSDFLSVSSVKRIDNNGPITFDIYLDHSSIEVFIDEGTNIFTEIFFPKEPYETVEVEGALGTIQELKKIWDY